MVVEICLQVQVFLFQSVIGLGNDSSVLTIYAVGVSFSAELTGRSIAITLIKCVMKKGALVEEGDGRGRRLFLSLFRLSICGTRIHSRVSTLDSRLFSIRLLTVTVAVQPFQLATRALKTTTTTAAAAAAATIKITTTTKKENLQPPF